MSKCVNERQVQQIINDNIAKGFVVCALLGIIVLVISIVYKESWLAGCRSQAKNGTAYYTREMEWNKK